MSVKAAISATQREALVGLVQPQPVERFLELPYPEQTPLVTSLLNRRDLVALAARRRHGKTTFATQLAIALAIPEPTFLGYEIVGPAKSLLLLVEDDPWGLQDKIRRQRGIRDTHGRIEVRTRHDFYAHSVPIDIRDSTFQYVVSQWAEQCKPDVIVFDNLAHFIAAEYNDSNRVHDLMKFCNELAALYDAAVVMLAHPRKQSSKEEYRRSLLDDPDAFFESVMGSSHFVNSTGSLWGLERNGDISTFVGGRQRGEGQQQECRLTLGDDGRFEVIADAEANLPLVTNTPGRQQAWALLPLPPVQFTFTQAQALVKPALRSSSSVHAWLRECCRLKVVVEFPDRRMVKGTSRQS